MKRRANGVRSSKAHHMSDVNVTATYLLWPPEKASAHAIKKQESLRRNNIRILKGSALLDL